MKFYITFIFFLSFLFSQDINDIVNLSNRDLDKLQKSLISEPIKASELESKQPREVVISSNNESNVTDYFGYSYFKRDINFFDNIPTPANYVLGPGDEVILSLWGETNFRESFTINKNGQIFYENIGFINLANLTLEQAELKIKEKFSDIYSTLRGENLSTTLNLELASLKSINVYFTGNIRKPGIHLIHPFSDIFSAIVQADGVKTEGSLRQVQLIRNGKVLHIVDFYSFFQNGLNSFSKIKLIDSDTIHIPNVISRIKIQGAVVRPAFYELLHDETLDSVIGYALDLNAKASTTVIIDRVIPESDRISDDNAISSINLNLKESKNIYLNDGDTLTIPEIKNVSSKIEIFGRVKSPGKYSAIDASLKDILDIAGGFNDPVYRKSVNEEIKILRKDENQFYSLNFSVNYEDAESFKLEVDDKIFVYEDINYRQNFVFTISGEINKPGTYPFKNGISLLEAIQLAGGITEMGSLENIKINQEFNGLTSRVLNVNLNFKLKPSSIIEILPFENTINVTGNVFNPGLLAFERGYTINKAIKLAGGYKPYSLKKNVYIKKSNGKIIKSGIFFGIVKKLDAGDTVIVPLDPNPSEFDITRFVSDLTGTLANLAAILVIIDRQN